jgi:hypothetical protein
MHKIELLVSSFLEEGGGGPEGVEKRFKRGNIGIIEN